RLHLDGELPGARPKQLAGAADEVADVEGRERRELFAELVGACVELDAATHVLQVGKAGLPVMADGDEPAGDAHGSRRLQLGVGRLLQTLAQTPGPGSDWIRSAERVDPARAEAFELRQALTDQLVAVVERAHAGVPLAVIREARMNASMSPSMTLSTLPTSTPVRWSFTSW